MADRAGILDAPALVGAIDRAADAATARTVVARVIEAHPDLADDLVEHRVLREGLVALACASRSLSSAVIADATLLDPLRDPDEFGRERDRRRPTRPRGGRTTDDDGGLRRWKRRELLAHRARDLLGVADMPGRRARARRARAGVPRGRARRSWNRTSPFAVIGMGKLGGRELNYASDIDVLFVHDGDADAPNAPRARCSPR